MWEKFKQALGNFVQKLFGKNKKEKLNEYPIVCEVTKDTDNIYTVSDEVWEEFLQEVKKLEKSANTYYPILPKRIPVKTLIVSTFTAQPQDAVGVDLSLLDDGIAHFFVMCKESMAEQAEKYIEKFCEDPEEWLDLEREGASCIVHNAVLLDYGDGRWDWYEV